MSVFIKFRLIPTLVILLAATGCAHMQVKEPVPDSFTLVVIPDTQNYIDFRHQQAHGWVLDGSAMFVEQMRYIASLVSADSSDVAFVASVGDVWQHQTKLIDIEHQKRGIDIEPDPVLGRRSKRTEQVLTIELPTAIEGYRIISKSGIPFGVAPGNHDYDAAWSVAGYPPNRDKEFSELERTVEDFGIMHVGGLDNFRSVFGNRSEFFKDKPWYIASFNGGANSAQVFSAAGYDFLHIALEMQPANDVLAWAESVLAQYPGLPTIITTHDYLDADGNRLPQELNNLSRIDPEFHNSAEQLWQKLIREHDQIFLVLCGHNAGQSLRIDNNLAGNPVYQVLADYQARGQAGIDAGSTKLVGLGDGWLRLMRFDFSTGPATITVKTFSSHYKRYSSQVEQYADWYKASEQPGMTNLGFYASDDYVITLDRFEDRFMRAPR